MGRLWRFLSFYTVFHKDLSVPWGVKTFNIDCHVLTWNWLVCRKCLRKNIRAHIGRCLIIVHRLQSLNFVIKFLLSCLEHKRIINTLVIMDNLRILQIYPIRWFYNIGRWLQIMCLFYLLLFVKYIALLAFPIILRRQNMYKIITIRFLGCFLVP